MRRLNAPEAVKVGLGRGLMLFTWSPDVRGQGVPLPDLHERQLRAGSIVETVTTPLTSYAPLLTQRGYTNGGKLWWRLAVVDEGGNVGAYTTGRRGAAARDEGHACKGSLTPRRRGTLIVTVRDAKGRAVRKALVRVSGAGARGRKRTSRKGVAKIRVRPTRRGTIKIVVKRRGFKNGSAQRPRRTAGGRPMSRSPVTVSDAQRRVLCERCTVADRPLSRLRGLLGRSELPRRRGPAAPPVAVHPHLVHAVPDRRAVPRPGPPRAGRPARAAPVAHGLADGRACRARARRGRGAACGTSVPATSSCSTRSEATMAAEHVISAAAVARGRSPRSTRRLAGLAVSPAVIVLAGVVALAALLRLGLTPYGVMAAGSLGVLVVLSVDRPADAAPPEQDPAARRPRPYSRRRRCSIPSGCWRR